MIVNCDRCGTKCQTSNRISSNARLLQRSAEKGLCANCAVTAFLKTCPLGQLIDDPQKLLWEPVQKQFAAVMRAGNADMDTGEISWASVVDNWNLPDTDYPRDTR